MVHLRRLHEAAAALVAEISVASKAGALTEPEAFSLTQPMGDFAQKLNAIVDHRLLVPVPPALRLPTGVGN